MNTKQLRNTKWSILVYTILLIIIGLIALYSATSGLEFAEFKKQLIWVVISIPIFIIFFVIDYKILVKISLPLYIISIILLILVLLTNAIQGASSWFSFGGVSLQPGEFAKIAVILYVANVMAKIKSKGEKAINKPLNILLVLGIVFLPVFLIILQPDYGTAIAYLLALVLMLFVAGIDKKYIIISVILVVIIVPLLYFFVLPQHAKNRIDVYLNPYMDPRGAGYNIIQSKLAVGGGRLLGQGFLKGTQTHLGFLYPKTTDFIFAVIAEEMGFIMCVAIVVIYVLLITKSIAVAKNSSDELGSYLAIGLVGILLFHIIENIGMTIGLLPITGVPLPFISYGGSSLITNIIIIALILNISNKDKQLSFG
ncbi:MAG: rod shape-determining protein RodA [Clostridia bacterium]